MAESKQEITAFGLWSQTLGNMKKGMKENLLLSFFFFALPSFFFVLIARGQGHRTVENIKQTTDNMLEGVQRLDYTPLYELLGQFASLYLVMLTLLFGLLVLCFSAFNLIALEKLDYYTSYKGSLTTLLKASLRLSLPKAFVILLVSFLLSSERALLGPIRLFSLLSLLALCISITEKRGALSSLWHSISLKFVAQVKGLGLSTLWMCFSTGALLFLYEHLVSFLLVNFQSLVALIPGIETVIYYRPEFLPCSLWKLFCDSLYFASYLFMFVFMVNFCCCLYTRTVKTLLERR